MAENFEQKKINIKIRFERVKERLKKLKGSLTTYLVISIIIHIVMIIIGEINFKKCPASPNIPVFLIAEGVIGLVSKLLSLGRNFILRYLKIDVILSVMGLVEVTFLICGSVWVYRAFEPKYDPAYEDRYCSRTLYLFSLIFISCVYILTFAFLFMVLCMLIGFCLLVSVSSDVVVEATVPEFTTQPAVQTESV